MRRALFLASISLMLIMILSATGCGDSEVKTSNSSNTDEPVERWSGTLAESRLYEAAFGDVVVTLEIPAKGEDAEFLRSTMSQSPPYLVGSMTVTNQSDEVARFNEFVPALVFSGGEKIEGQCAVLFETDMVAPEESLDALFTFGVTSLEGLDKVVISSRNQGEKEATLVSSGGK